MNERTRGGSPEQPPESAPDELEIDADSVRVDWDGRDFFYRTGAAVIRVHFRRPSGRGADLFRYACSVAVAQSASAPGRRPTAWTGADHQFFDLVDKRFGWKLKPRSRDTYWSNLAAGGQAERAFTEITLLNAPGGSNENADSLFKSIHGYVLGEVTPAGFGEHRLWTIDFRVSDHRRAEFEEFRSAVLECLESPVAVSDGSAHDTVEEAGRRVGETTGDASAVVSSAAETLAMSTVPIEEVLSEIERTLPSGRWEVHRCCSPHSDLRGIQVRQRDWSEPLLSHVDLRLVGGAKAVNQPTLRIELETRIMADWGDGARFLERLRQLTEQLVPQGHDAAPQSLSQGNGDYSPSAVHCWTVPLGSTDAVERLESNVEDAVDALSAVASLVDEAWYLRDKQTLWRTDFGHGAGAKRPSLVCPVRWPEGSPNGPKGGQKPIARIGRLGSDCLRINGTVGNYGPVDEAGRATRNICRLISLEEMRNLPINRRLYVSCVIHSTQEVTICVLGGGRTGKSGYPVIVEVDRSLPGTSGWRQIGIEATTCIGKGESGRAEGFTLYLVTETADTKLRIDCVDVGIPNSDGSAST
jgi:hypothetical protein